MDGRADAAAPGLLAHYDSLDAARRAIESLRSEGFTAGDLEVFSPVPAPELERAMGIETSPVRRWALLGGITGCVVGLLLTTGTSLAYPMVTQGKPIVSMPPFIVIMFELTILLTGLFTLVGMLVHARKPTVKLSPRYREAFSVDRWGVFVAAGADDEERARRLAREAGAVEIESEPETAP
jgi:hypothetical protein